MTENRFKQGQYEDALQFTKDILSSSYTLKDILLNSNIVEDFKDTTNTNLNKTKEV